MKHYKNAQNKIYGFEDLSEESIAQKGLIEITKLEAEIILQPQPSMTEVKANVLDFARALRFPIVSILDGLQSSANTTGDITLALQIESLKVGLRNITATDLSAAQTKEQALKSIVDAYKLIAASAPASIKAYFLDVLTKAQKI